MVIIENLERRPLCYDLEEGSFRLLSRESSKIKEEEITEKMRMDEENGTIRIKKKEVPKAKFVEETEEEEK